MKIKNKFIIFYKIVKFFHRKYLKLFNSFYKQKLNSIIIDLKNKNVEINTIFDIGAYRGDWSVSLNETCLKNKDFYLFEANIENEKYLRDLNFTWFIKTLSDKEKEVEFYSKVHPGDSYYLEKTNFYEKNLKPKVLKTTTLDDIQKINNLPLPDFIKVDTQGSEIDILKGSKKTLEKCKLILLECPIISYNNGAPNLNEYINYLNSIDFLPIDACEIHHIDKVFVQIDIIFLKKDIFYKIYNEKKILNLFN